MPFLAAMTVVALLIFAFGLVPAHFVPSYRMSIVLEEHRQQFAFIGGLVLLGSAIFFVLTISS